MAGRTAAAAGSCWTCWRSQERIAPSQSRALCCRLCLAFTGEKRAGMERSGPTPSALLRASLPSGSGTGGAPTATAERHSCWTGAGHMYLLVCIGSLYTLFAADFGPGLERASEGRTAGRRVRFLRLLPPTSGMAWRKLRRVVQLDREFAFYASRRQLQAWPVWDGGGARSWTWSLLFYASRRQLRAWPG